MFMFLFFISCANKIRPAVIEKQPPTVETQPTSDRTLLEQLLPHESTLCRDLSYKSATPWLELAEMLDVPRPPWVAMRAAACMIEVYPQQSRGFFLAWLNTPNQKGLALLLCSSFEQLPINEQRILLEPALTGIYAESCAQRLKNSPIDEVRERAHKAFP